MKFAVARQGGTLIVTVSGRLSGAMADRFKDPLLVAGMPAMKRNTDCVGGMR